MTIMANLACFYPVWVNDTVHREVEGEEIIVEEEDGCSGSR